jgi:hypothetical protein
MFNLHAQGLEQNVDEGLANLNHYGPQLAEMGALYELLDQPAAALPANPPAPQPVQSVFFNANDALANMEVSKGPSMAG